MGETIENDNLPQKTLKVKYIKKRQGMAQGVTDDHVISGGLLEGATRSFPVAMTRTGALKNVLSKSEMEFFKKLMPEENFSVYGKFWKDRRVKLKKQDTILDLSTPDGFLDYKVLLTWNQVIASSYSVYKNQPSPAYQFYIEDNAEIENVQKNLVEIKQKAYRLFAGIDQDKETMSAVLFLIGGKRVSSTKIDYLRSQVGLIVDKKPEKFNNLLEDDHFKTKCLVASAERLGVIKKSNSDYVTAEGQPLTNKGKTGTVANIVEYLNDPINNEVRELLVSRVENALE